MKITLSSLISLMICASLEAQPFTVRDLAWNWPYSAASCFDYSSISSGNMFVWLSTCPQSVANNISQSGGVVGTWLDHTTKSNSFDATVSFGGSVAPAYHATGGSHGGEWVDFSRAGGNGDVLGCLKALGTNQPVTMFIVHTDTCTAGGNSLFDTISGGREHYRLISSGSDFMFAGSAMSPPPSKNSLKWMVRTIVFNGATSYVRTNGVLQGVKGNPGAGALGKMALGNDQSSTTPFRGGMEYVLIYSGELNTNDMQSVETHLISEAAITP